MNYMNSIKYVLIQRPLSVRVLAWGGGGAGIEGGEGHYAVQLESGRNDSV